MRALLLPLVILVAAYSGVQAQGPQMIDSVLLRTRATQDPLRWMTFGFSPEYTDGMDCRTHNECEIPVIPPQQFWVMFISPTEHVGTNKDIRGVPDSVGSSEVRSFRLRYELDITRYADPQVTVSFPRGLRPGVDSVVVFDNITGGNVFRHAFTGGRADTATIPFEGIRSITMDVYIDLDRLSASVTADLRLEPLRLFPNPAHAGSPLRFEKEIASGQRVEITNMLGEMVASGAVAPAVPGVYTVWLLDRLSRTIRSERLVVLP